MTTLGDPPIILAQGAQAAAASAVAAVRRRAQARELSPLARQIAADPRYSCAKCDWDDGGCSSCEEHAEL